MRELQIFAIHDSMAEGYIQPFFLGNEALGKRAFQHCVQDQDHQFNKSPGDFTLFHLGSFDVVTAEILQNSSPKSLGNGLQYRHLSAVEPET